MLRYGLRDDRWEGIEGLLPGRVGPVGVTSAGDRLSVGAVLYRYRTGLPWRGLPERFGCCKNVQRRHSRWSAAGVWERLLRRLAADADTECAMIGGTVVRAHQHSAGGPKQLAQTAPARTRRPGAPAVA